MSFRHSALICRVSTSRVTSLLHFCCSVLPLPVSAASIRGVVTDASGARVTGATVVLFSNGQVVASAVSAADGSFQITDRDARPVLSGGLGQELPPT